VEKWLPYFYVYGIGAVVFFGTLAIAHLKGALSKPRKILPLLLGGFAFYLTLHGILQAVGTVGPMPVTGDAVGTEESILQTKDIAVVLLYFGAIVGAGAYFARFTRTTSDYFFGGRRFSGWLIAVSCVATTIGAYSFVKYGSAAFSYGFASSMTYLNDWFWMPLWMLVWLPIVYYGRIESVPEYFNKRFSPGTRRVVTLILLLYLIGYVGINFLTLGTAMHALTGWSVFLSACLAATATAIYVAAGGQTSVIMTDLVQGLILLVVGLGLFVAGVDFLGGFGVFWEYFPDVHQTGLANLNHPDSFHTMGVFWQDAMAGGIAFYFMNQGILMRFMSARSVDEGRKAIAMVALVVMPLAAISVSGVGWIGRALATTGATFQGTELAMIEPDNIFVIVTNILTTPGIFGLVMATLTAALMSTADTLLTAVSAIIVNDIWRPLTGETEDASDLRVGRLATVGAAAVGIVLVPVFQQFESIYVAHATFTAAIVPPMAVTLVLGALWPRFGSKAALVTLIGGSAAIVASVIEPSLIEPVSQGVEPTGEGADKFNYMRALFGLLTSAGLGVVAAGLIEPAEEPDPLLVAGPESEAKQAFKGAPVKEGGAAVELAVQSVDEAAETREGTDEALVRLHPGDLETLGAQTGDLLHVAVPGVWHGGLLSVQARVADGRADDRGRVEMADQLLRAAGLNDGGDAVVRLVG